MTTPPIKPCEAMTVSDFVESWRPFLNTLRDKGHSWIADRDGILADDLRRMWDGVLGELIDRSDEIAHAIADDGNKELLCQIIWGIGAWDPDGPFGGISGGVPGAFVSARMIKEAVERWLGSRLSPETRALLKALNQLLCMLRCL